MEHAVICGCDAPVNRVGLTRQAMAFLTEPSFIHSLTHVTEGGRALTCFNLSTSVTNTSPLIQRSCTDLFALFNIIQKKKKTNFSFLFCISCFDSDLFVGFAKLSKPLLSFFNRALFDYVFPIFSPSHLVFSLFSLSISQYSLFIFFGSDLLFF